MNIKHLLFASILSLMLTQMSCTSQAGEGTPQQDEKTAKEVCIQLYSVRDLLKDNTQLEQVLQQLADMGYTSVEAANYNDGKFYGKTPQEFRQLVEKTGMTVLSSHTTRSLTSEELASGKFDKALEWWKQCIADHKAAGMKYIVTPWMAVPKTIKELQTYCDYFNAVGKLCQEAGIQYGYHNHSHEFQKVEDKEVMLDYMLAHTDPAYVFFQMDVYWVVRGQNSPVDYINQYPGRFKMLHIKDHREIGQSGMVGYDAIFRQVDKAGVQDIVAEIEQYSVPVLESVQQSLHYLQESSFVPNNYTRQ